MIEDEHIFNLIENEYNNIFKENHTENEMLCLKEYVKDIPFKIKLRESVGTKIIDIFIDDNMNELSDEFKELTKAEDIMAPIISNIQKKKKIKTK